jgi:hypothetical protein
MCRCSSNGKIELTAFNAEAGMLLRDLIDVGLIDATWTNRVPHELSARLQELLDNQSL